MTLYVVGYAFAIFHLPRRFAGFGGVEVRMHGKSIHATRGKLVLLVLHQGDQRAHDHGEPPAHERRRLVAEALPPARGQDEQEIPPPPICSAALTVLGRSVSRAPGTVMSISRTVPLPRSSKRMLDPSWKTISP